MKPSRWFAVGSWTLALTVAPVALFGCGSDDPPAASQATGSTCPSGSALDYESFGRAFMQTYCTRCHSSSLADNQRQGAPSDHDFDSLENIKATPAEHIDEEAAAGPNGVNTAMPPGDPRPTEAERRQLGEWLACGTP